MGTFSNSINFKLLQLSIKLGDVSTVLSETEKIIKENKIDWNDLYESADFHCVRPQLNNLLNRISTSLVPLATLQKLKEANLENVYQQMRNVGEFFEIKRLLDEVGIAAVPFKGFWLAHAFYENLANRESVDVDLLIDVGSLDKIKSIMEARGYTPEWPLGQLSMDHIVNDLCEYNFDKYTNGTRIFHFEFHWRISIKVYEMDITLADLKNQLTTRVIQNRELTVFTSSANLLLAIMHHGGKDQFLQLKQVMDIALIIKKENQLDWNWIVAEARRFHIEQLLYIAVSMASSLTGVIIPGEIRDRVNTKFIQRLANGRVKMMAIPSEQRNRWWHTIGRWSFQVSSRSSKKIGARIIFYEIRKEILPQLVPKKFHNLFLNKKIRTNPGG